MRWAYLAVLCVPSLTSHGHYSHTLSPPRYERRATYEFGRRCCSVSAVAIQNFLVFYLESRSGWYCGWIGCVVRALPRCFRIPSCQEHPLSPRCARPGTTRIGFSRYSVSAAAIANFLVSLLKCRNG